MEELLENYKNEVVLKMFNFQDEKRDALHIEIGLKSEAMELASALKRNIGYGKELDFTNILEELGDYLFFMMVYSHNQKWVIGNVREPDFEHQIRYKDRLGFDELRYIYRRIEVSLLNYEKSFSYIPKHLNIAEAWLYDLLYIANYFGFTLKDLIGSNTNKLTFRHKGKEFNKDTVTERDIEVERQKLEQ